jgi:hypothetical protein
MRRNSKVLDFASKLWPIRHGRFEEMCSLAVTGQLGGAQMCELDEHIVACESCRKFLGEIAQVSVQAMPLLAEKHGAAPQFLPPQGIRERFLARLASETSDSETGTAMRPIPMPAVRAYAVSRERETTRPIGEEDQPAKQSLIAVRPRLWRPVAIAIGCMVVAIAAYYAGVHRTVHAPPQLTQAHPVTLTAPLPPESTSKESDSDRVSELERQKSELETKLVNMKQELSTAESERESLSNELASAKERLATLTANRSIQDSPVVGQQPGEQVATLQAQVDRLGQRLAEEEVTLDVQKHTSKELSAKLDSTSSDLQRERDLKSAKSELGDLVAARNLHIVDVYDADGNGRRQQSFGRVFYIEGKSLVFYAYDLDDPGRFKTSVVFHVWGGKAGMKEVTHSLGILHKDDASQNRWAMTFDDPSVLAQINSVFVTAESANKHYDEPHGKKVLYAYFGSQPNHP